MFAPQPIARGKIVYPCKIVYLVNGCLPLRNPQLMFELATSSDFHTELLLFNLLLFEIVKRMGATGVCPHVREGNLLSCSLLEKELAAHGMEDEGGEGSMEETLVDILHQVAWDRSHFVRTQQLAPTKKVLNAATHRFSCQVHRAVCRSHRQ